MENVRRQALIQKVEKTLAVCIIRFETTELGQVDFYGFHRNFQNQKLMIFSLLYSLLGDVKKLYDVNQNEFVFTFKNYKIIRMIKFISINIHMHILMHTHERKNKVVLVNIIRFLTPQVLL